MRIELLGKFYDNHSLSIVNRNIAINMANKGADIKIIALDTYDPEYKLDKEVVKQLKLLEEADKIDADIQVRHTYPPMWQWPVSANTKVVYIQPWEFPKVPFEWQYKFETFADALIVPSNYCKEVFLKGGINPNNIFVIPNGYDENIFNREKQQALPEMQADKFNFVYVGNSQWRKGLDILLNVWSTTFKKYDNAKLIIKDNPKIYGRNNILAEIIKLQYKTDCGEIIYISRDLSDEEMASLYKNSKVIVHPYRAEGFGMHVQEAVACGCVPIISANGPTDDFIPNDIGIKIDTNLVAVNIDDSKLFAIKPGDSTTLMGSHTFIREPVTKHLHNALNHIYHSHANIEMFNKVKDIKTLSTWNVVADLYINAITSIYNTEGVNRI